MKRTKAKKPLKSRRVHIPHYKLESSPVSTRNEFEARCWFIFGAYVNEARRSGFVRLNEKQLLKHFIVEATKGRVSNKPGPKADYLPAIRNHIAAGMTLRKAVAIEFNSIGADKGTRASNYTSFELMPNNEQRTLLSNIRRSLRRTSDLLTIKIPRFTRLGFIARENFAFLCAAVYAGKYMPLDFALILSRFKNVIESGVATKMFNKKRLTSAKVEAGQINGVVVLQP